MYCYCMFVICQEISVHSAYITWYLNGAMVNVPDSYRDYLAWQVWVWAPSMASFQEQIPVWV